MPQFPGDPETALIAVPHVVTLSHEDAAGALAELGFEVAVRSGPSAEVDVGIVTLQDPPPGTPLPSGSTVRIIVGGGPDEPVVIIPDPDGERGEPDEAPVVGPKVLPE